VRWSDFAAARPELASLALAEFERTGMALVGTLRRDGSPRISCVLPCVLEGDLYLGMMWRSRKAIDLLRDPRLVLHNAVATNAGDELEVAVHGRAVTIEDEDGRRRFVAAAPEWAERRFHLFRLEIESAGVVRYRDGLQHVEVWPRDKSFTRPY
jgi:hypothetical protein